MHWIFFKVDSYVICIVSYAFSNYSIDLFVTWYQNNFKFVSNSLMVISGQRTADNARAKPMFCS